MKLLSSLFLICFSLSIFAYSEEDLEKLKRGEDCKGCDLSGLDLSGANLSGANLSGANLYGLSGTKLFSCPESLPEDWQCNSEKYLLKL